MRSEASKNKKQNESPRRMLWPVTIAIAGTGAILIAIYLANRKIAQIIDESQYDVENYEVMDKPFIYGICE